jgi:hypothetical protein
VQGRGDFKVEVRCTTLRTRVVRKRSVFNLPPELLRNQCAQSLLAAATITGARRSRRQVLEKTLKSDGELGN